MCVVCELNVRVCASCVRCLHSRLDCAGFLALGFLDNEKILESRATNLNTLKPYSNFNKAVGTDNHLTARHALSKRPA